MSEKKTANINHNWLRGFLRYFIPNNQRRPISKHSGPVYSGGYFKRGATPGAFGNPKQHHSFDPRVTNHMRMKMLQALKEKAVINAT